MEGTPRAIERKVITALFCDVVGSTELGERLDPEDVDRLMSRYHALARRRIEANGGTVEKFIGDAVVGVFGAPLVHEDDPARAIRAGLAILRELEAAGLGIQARIGLQTGEAVVRVGADRTAEEGLATGDILNTAARLQGAAPVGGIAAGDPTYRLTSIDFDWVDLGEAVLKGKAEPVHVWQPVGPKAAGAPTSESTAFVGRADELATLVRAFERAANGPTVELVTIIAEPGMGKSRLVRELRRRVLASGDVTWRAGRSLPYGDGVAYWALGEIVKAQAEILDTDDRQTVADKLSRAIDEPDETTRAWLRDRLSPLVGLPTEAATPPREELFAAWSRFLTAIARRGSLVLVFEDLHWADEALLDFLAHLGALGDAIPLLIITTARPEISERHPGWLERADRTTRIQLVSLGDQAVRALLAESLPGAPEAFLVAVVERAEGSPLFAEQLAALARERGDGRTGLDETAIPPTIRALLAARIDGLPTELKPALLDASVIGRVFWSGAVATLEAADPDSIADALDDLARRELARLVPSSMADEREYAFWHALLRDVAYSFLPRAARLAKHRAAAAWISARPGSGGGEHAEIVADHLRHALDLATALDAQDELSPIRSDLADALLGAAQHTLAFEPARAARHADEAAGLLEPDDVRLPLTRIVAGRARMARSENPLAVTALDAAADWYTQHGDAVAAAELAVLRARARAGAGDATAGAELIDAARPVLEANPGRGLVALLEEQARRAAADTDLVRTTALADEAVSLAARLNLPAPHEALISRAMARMEAHDPRGEPELLEAIELAMAAGDSRSALDGLRVRGYLLMEDHHVDTALSAYDEAIAFARRYGLSDGQVRASRFDLLDTAGRWDELLAEGEALRADAVARGDAWTEFMVRMQMASARVRRGEVTLPVDDLLADAQTVGLRSGIGGGLMAESRLLRGDAEGARQAVADTLAAVGDGRWAFDVLTLTRVALATGDLELAEQVLAKAMPEGGPTIRSALTTIATGLVHEAHGRFAEALERLLATSARFTKLGWPLEQAITLVGLGRTRIELGEPQAGLADLEAARAIIVRLGMQPMLSDIDVTIAAARGTDGAATVA